jgi:hypothetical protein
MMHLHDNLSSGNGYKVLLLLAQLGLPFERIEYDIDRGETRTEAFLEEINANGRVPVLETDEGELLPESGAIPFYHGPSPTPWNWARNTRSESSTRPARATTTGYSPRSVISWRR